MKFRAGILVVVFLSLLAPVDMAGADRLYTPTSGADRVSILSEEAFQDKFGSSTEIPRSESEIIALAAKLFPPAGQVPRERVAVSGEEVGEEEECGTRKLGLLYAALQNPAVSAHTREAVDRMMLQSTPDLPRTQSFDHFVFHYNDDPASPNYASEANIAATAAVLNRCWSNYATYFRKPKFYNDGPLELIDIKVLSLPGLTPGRTHSTWDAIELDNLFTVANECNRKTIPAHELFHRVQYAYGFESGTPDEGWMVEGTAAWAQKWTYNSLKDYLDWMNNGLKNPNLDLIKERNYGACHFWVHLQERLGSSAIREAWTAYSTQTNGKDAKAALETVLRARLKMSFNQYVQEWHKANYIKDLENAPKALDYADDGKPQVVFCGFKHGPLARVPRKAKTIQSNATSFVISDYVRPYGAQYYQFRLGTALTNLQIKVDGDNTGNFYYYVQAIKNNAGLTNFKSNGPNFVLNRTITAGQWDTLVLIVMGMSKGGSFTITCRDNDLSRYRIARMGLRSYDTYHAVYSTGGTNDYSENRDHDWNGTVVGGFTGNTFKAEWNIPGWNRYIGSIKVTVDLNTQKAVGFTLNKTMISGDIQENTVTSEEFTGTSIGMISKTEHGMSFFIKGAQTCSHLSSLTSSKTYTSNYSTPPYEVETKLTDHVCNAESRIYIDFYPEN